jgi:hypothetical protein
MTTFVIVAAVSGILFGVLDGVINANPVARRLLEVYKPITRTSLNPVRGFLIDLMYGFAMAGMFLLLYQSLPGEGGLLKGISFALIAWFFRVVMSVASQWMMFRVPVKTLLYVLVTGLVEMLVLGILFGSTLKPLG